MSSKNFFNKQINLPESIKLRFLLHWKIVVIIISYHLLISFFEFLTDDIHAEELIDSFIILAIEGIIYLLTLSAAEKFLLKKQSNKVYIIILKWLFFWAISFLILLSLIEAEDTVLDRLRHTASLVLNNIVPYIVTASITLFLFSLKQNPEPGGKKDIQLLLKHIDGEIVLKLSMIVYARSEGNYLHLFYLNTEKEINSIFIRMTLKELLSRFADDKSFIRTQRSYIVNFNYIHSLKKVNGKYIASLIGVEEKIPVSHEPYTKIRRILDQRSIT